MKAIMVMFDSLNRRMLSPYGCDWVQTPNFQRLADRSITFDHSYVGSMPCMPARRELHTGRYNFLHNGWGPLEPYDDSMPARLAEHGVYTHLVSDHYHYWEDGGCTYHTRYNTWEISRGQEGDPWKGVVKDPDIPPVVGDHQGSPHWRQDWINRSYMQAIADQPQPKTFAMGEEFIHTNHAEDQWFLTIETFDPHEPYFSSDRYKQRYPHSYAGKHFDWPPYANVTETPEEVEHVRLECAALHSMCDDHLGRVLDLMDRYDLWKDTLLIVNTDHGFLLGEHDRWAKCCQPFYNEVAHTPLFIWDPRIGKAGERRQSLVQTIDLAPTLLEYFGVARPPDMQGHPLRDTLLSDQPVRDAALFGMFGGHVNCTDGRFVYMRAPATADNTPMYAHTLMPTHMRGFCSLDELRTAELAPPFSFTKGTPLIRYNANRNGHPFPFETMLFDVKKDPAQNTPIRDAAREQIMINHMIRLMQETDAPPSQFDRLGLR